jgi:hypothetical protein
MENNVKGNPPSVEEEKLVLAEISARIYRPSFHKNKPKTLVFESLKTSALGLFSRKLGL